MENLESCPICSKPLTPFSLLDGGCKKYSCVKCGDFEIGNIASQQISNWTIQQRTNLSGWLRENQGFRIVSSNQKPLSELPSLSVGEKAEKLLVRLAKKFPNPGENLDLSGPIYLEFLAVARALNLNEFRFLMREYLHAETGLLLMNETGTGLTRDEHYKISPKGWEYLDSLRRGNPNSQTGFIAMWFDDSMKPAHLAIEAGIRNAGYKAFRVDQKEHNNDITDEIIAGIRGSKFLVADLTGHRNGVYYEAGFAKGLGLEVVWLCRESDEKDRHFDIRQLSTIFWEDDKLPELSKALENRIVATIGRGPMAEKV